VLTSPLARSFAAPRTSAFFKLVTGKKSWRICPCAVQARSRCTKQCCAYFSEDLSCLQANQPFANYLLHYSGSRIGRTTSATDWSLIFHLWLSLLHPKSSLLISPVNAEHWTGTLS
jgi:hypothetical protein